MNYGEMKKMVALGTMDPSMKMLEDVEYGSFVNAAIQDLSASGWLAPIEEDETTTLASDDYDYAIPASFAYIRELRMEDTSVSPSVYDMVIPFEEWRLTYDGTATSYIVFISRLFRFTSGDHVKIVGQKRPSELSSDSTAITAGMEPFIRERAISYAARTQAMMLPERMAAQVQAMEGESAPGTRVGSILPDAEERRARRLMGLAQQAWGTSEDFLAKHAVEFRVQTGSIHVPGR